MKIVSTVALVLTICCVLTAAAWIIKELKNKQDELQLKRRS